MLCALLSLLQAAGPQTSLRHSGPEPEVRIERDILCRTIGSFAQQLDAYLPPGRGPHPALLLVHGGAWMFGDKRDMSEFGQLLARAGYACFAPEYRLAPADPWPAQILDCLYALQFVRANAARFGVDPERVGALGLSAGAHLVALLGVLDELRTPDAADAVLRQSTRVRCVVDYFGPVLLTPVRVLDFDTQPPPELFGDAPYSVYRNASPVCHVSADDAPFLLVHSVADEIVSVRHSLLMARVLRKVGVGRELVLVPGARHGQYFLHDSWSDHWKRVERFLALHLGAPKAGARAR